MTRQIHTDFETAQEDLLRDSYGLSATEDRSLNDIRGMAAVRALRSEADRRHTRADNAIIRDAERGRANPYLTKLGIGDDELDDFVDQVEGMTDAELDALERELGGIRIPETLAHALDYRDNAEARSEYRAKRAEKRDRLAAEADDFEANASAAEETERKIFEARYWGYDKLFREQERERLGLPTGWRPPEGRNAFGGHYDDGSAV
jgi:hypothetical protein